MFMDWYPRYTQLYRRKKRGETEDLLKRMNIQFDELKPFFIMMEKSIKLEVLSEALEDATRWENSDSTLWELIGILENKIEEIKK